MEVEEIKAVVFKAFTIPQFFVEHYFTYLTMLRKPFYVNWASNTPQSMKNWTCSLFCFLKNHATQHIFILSVHCAHVTAMLIWKASVKEGVFECASWHNNQVMSRAEASET